MKTNASPQTFWLLCDSPGTPAVFRALFDGGEVTMFVACASPLVAGIASRQFGKVAQPYPAVEFMEILLTTAFDTATDDLLVLTDDLNQRCDRPDTIKLSSLLADREVCDLLLKCGPERFAVAGDGQHVVRGPGDGPFDRVRRKICEMLLPRLDAAIRKLRADVVAGPDAAGVAGSEAPVASADAPPNGIPTHDPSGETGTGSK
jgi:hypothetical protein